MKKILTVLLLMIGTLSAAYASEEVSLTALVNNATLTFNTGEMPVNSVITAATLNLKGNDTSNGVELFDIRVLANGQIAGSLSSDYWVNDAENSIELDASKLNVINNQIQLQIASSLEGSEYVAKILPATATLVVSYEEQDTAKARSREPRATTVITAISARYYHTVALKADGTVWSWGYNGSGQLGDGSYINATKPLLVQNITDVSAIASSESYTIVLKTDKTVWGWGYNSGGSLGSDSKGVTPAQITGLADISAIAAGGSHTVFLKTDGTVWGLGDNGYGQLGDDTTSTYYNSTPVQAIGLTGVSAVAAGSSHTVALKTDGTVWTWGYNYYGQLGDGMANTDRNMMPAQVSGLTGVSKITAGKYNTFAIKTDGSVWAWGKNDYGQLGNGTKTDSKIPVQVTGLTGVSAIAASSYHTVALKTDGTVWAWGQNWNGELGDGTGTNSSIPVQAKGLTTNIKAIAAGDSYTVVLKTDGTIWAWGDNYSGQLGDGTTTDSKTPLQVTFPTGSQPTVTTGAAESIAESSATLNGTVNPNGLDTTWYFQYGKTSSYGLKTAVQNAGSGTANITATANITGLALNTKYYFRLVATNSIRTTYGLEQTFTTVKPVTKQPSVTTGSATAKANSATINGIVNPNGLATNYYFEYGLTTSYGKTTTSQSVSAGYAGTSVTASITDLTASTTYNFRLVATNSLGTTNGTNQTFTTPGETDPKLALSSASGAPNGTVTVNLTLTNITGSAVAAVSTDIAFDPNVLETPSAVIGTAGTSAGKTITTRAVGTNVFRVGVLSMDNNNAIGNGVVASVTFKIKSTATNGATTQLTQTATGSNQSAGEISVTGTAGTITINSCGLGDCNCDGKVSIAEVQAAINMYLGINSVQSCCDRDGNGSISISEVQAVINNYLGIVSTSTKEITEDKDDYTERTVTRAGTPTLTLEGKTATAGGPVKLALTLSGQGTSVASISTDISYDVNLFASATAEIGPSGTTADKTISQRDLGGGVIRVGVMSINNNNIISDGVVAYLTLTAKSTATGTASIKNTASGSNQNAQEIVITGNTAQVSFGSTGTITKPVVTTGAAASITSSSAKLTGTVTPKGASTTYYFEYGATTSYGAKTSSLNAGSGTTAISVKANMLGLTPNTTYHFRLVATNSAGTTYGADKVFSTALKPLVTTSSATSITSTSAILNGSVDPNGGVTDYYFEYGTTTSYGSITRDKRSKRVSTSVNESVTGLSKNTLYHFRLVATNSAGTTYGLDKTFTTLQ